MERSSNSPLVLVLVLLLPGLSSAWVHVCEINGTHVKGYTNTNTTTANNNNNTTTANNNNNNTTITPTNKNYTNDDNTNNNNTTTAIINNNNNYTNDDNNNNTPPVTNNNTNLTLHAGVPFLVHIFDESEPSYFYVISDECDTYIRVGIKRTSRPVTDDSMSDELGRLWAWVRYMTDTEGLLHVYFDGGVESHLTGRIRGQSCIPTHYVFRFINLDVGLECAQEVHRKEPHPHPHHPPPRHSTPIIIWVPLVNDRAQVTTQRHQIYTDINATLKVTCHQKRNDKR
ncbi:hypothetical protein Pmani_024453 [Petrolisthes manimaculis]|uniref:Uncharacterized protein n=1 Tax=Petrolisthes manimaculis TaxID=1843537 RepID=A0AAE1P9Q9_9EUCA|nr:hypothetical protein Pmani_024453 [Petrolisthes manimaculis]